MNNNEQPQGRVNPTKSLPKNPAFLFAEWSSKDKCFTYYDKVNKVKDVKLPFPISFIPLYKCICLKGYNHPKNENHTSNEIDDGTLETSPFVVRTYNNLTKKAEVRIKGLYKSLSDQIELNKIKYTVSLYAGLKNKKGEMMLVNFGLNGGALTHWFDFENKEDIWKGTVKVDGITEETNGSVKFNAPTYKMTTITPEDDIKAGELQKKITEYLKDYFAKNANILSDPAPVENKQTIDPLPNAFNQTKQPGIVTSTDDDDDSIPF